MLGALYAPALGLSHTREDGQGEADVTITTTFIYSEKKNNQRQYLCLAEDSPAKGPSLPEWQERTINGVGSDRAVATTGNKERTLCCGH